MQWHQIKILNNILKDSSVSFHVYFLNLTNMIRVDIKTHLLQYNHKQKEHHKKE